MYLLIKTILNKSNEIKLNSTLEVVSGLYEQANKVLSLTVLSFAYHF